MSTLQGLYRKVAEYGDYEIFDVYRKLEPADRDAIAEFWLLNKALSSRREAQYRAGQVTVAVARERRIVAVSSVYVERVSRSGQLYYFYRKFVEPGHRIYLMWREMLTQSYAILKAWEPTQLPQKPLGVIVVPENAKLTRKSVLRAGNKVGFFTVGYLPNGDPVYGRKFDESVTENLIAQDAAQSG